MYVQQTSTFQRTIKKLVERDKKIVHQIVESLMLNPHCGESKLGDLAGVRVMKFPMNKQTTLLAYAFDEHSQVLTLLALGSHENFYRDLKR